MSLSRFAVAPLACLLGLSAASAAAPDEAKRLGQSLQRFAPVELVVDLSALPASERASLAKQVAAAKIIDALFLRQAWAGNESLLLDLVADHSPLGQARLANFLLFKGPWDGIDHDRAFVPGVPARPEGANFYPAGASKEEVERWIATLPPEQQAEARDFYATVRRLPGGGFTVVPYSLEYQGELAQAAALLREAAQLTQQPTLKKFLDARAAAFLSNDYYASEVAWMELDASLEPTIGPYEVYADGWFNYKAAFEAYITVRDAAESAKLARFGAQLQRLEDHLPIDPALRNTKLGALAPIVVVNELYCSGDASHGVQTAAYNLPNDERVTAEKGSKRVMLKNVQQAKFERVLLPISKIALAPAHQRNVQFDAFFTHILMHELMHGLGPHGIAVEGQPTTVRQALKEASSAFEEAKADIAGLWAMQQLIDAGVLDRALERTMYDSFLASAFRTLRFGSGEAHGKGMAMQLNWLLDEGGVVVDAQGRFAIAPAKIKAAVTSLTTRIMTVQAHGDYTAAREMLDRLGVVRPAAQAVIDRLAHLPIDIAPRFVTAEQLLREGH